MRPVRLASRSKYGVNQSPEGKLARTVDGILFDSQAEADHYCLLQCRQRAGQIGRITLQPRFPLTVCPLDDPLMPVKIGDYVADFAYSEPADGPQVIDEVKGFRTALYRWKKKHVEAQYGITIREIHR